MMKQIKHIMIAVLTNITFGVFAAEVPLPVNVVLENLPKGMTNSWKQLGSIPMTFSAALRKFENTLARNGWKQIQAFYYDNTQKKKFEIWSKEDAQILFHFWRISPDKTGFSWGELDKDFISKNNKVRKVNRGKK